ncbi:hypothetical protein RvY_18847 [Ramazzottius varieornatus]|uniref:C2 domain-containing protein n=1 Tax=Ramazzottius varieornatus TaxID=947166 RepID=A0A1D1WA35_RAMVA|nr:hypothetical protein RvY_18847 [Ramazzottius varieornatus]
MNEPTIDFNMTNLLNAPGFGTLKSTVMSIAKENIRWYLVLPNKISVPFGEIHYKDFMFVPPVGIVRVHVVGGRNLPVTDRVNSMLGTGSSDPYVVLQLGAREARTKGKKKTLNPVFDEMFDFMVTEPQGQRLILTLWDADMVKDELIGEVRIDIAFLQKTADTADYWHFISGPSKGQLNIRLTWLELTTSKSDLTAAIHEVNVLTPYGVFAPLSTGILVVLIDSAQQLPMVGTTWGKERLPNPSVVLTLSAQKFVSRVLLRTQNPVWEQFTIFYVNNPLVENLSILVKDDISPAPLGTYTFPLASLLEVRGPSSVAIQVYC